MRPIKFGMILPANDFRKTVALAQHAEKAGFYSVSISDHLYTHPPSPSSTPALECFTTLSAIAGATDKIKLTSAVICYSYRNPALLAKMISSLDHISAGRFIIGLGSGWMQEEYEAYGYRYPSDSERLDQLEETVKLLKVMFTEDEPTYHGRFFSINKAYNYPKPVQKPYPPLMFGGSGKRTLEICGCEGDILNLLPPRKTELRSIYEKTWHKFDKADVKRRIARMRGYAEAAGRDPDAVEISSFSFVLMAMQDTDAAAKAQTQILRNIGIPNPESAGELPVFFMGSVEQIKREIQLRIEKLGITYFIMRLPSVAAVDLFAQKIIPEFS